MKSFLIVGAVLCFLIGFLSMLGGAAMLPLWWGLAFFLAYQARQAKD